MSEEVDVGDDVAALLDIIRCLMADIRLLRSFKAQTMEALDEAKADIRELKSAVRWLEENP